MNSMRGPNQPTQLVIHNDDDTPDQFVMDLLRQVFGKSDREATALITQIEQKERAVCGPYPQSVAEALFKSAQQSIGLAGHQLQVTLEAVTLLANSAASRGDRWTCVSAAARSGCAATACVRRMSPRTNKRKISTLLATFSIGTLPAPRAASS
ncbi:ATP-dependent Clp protease adaptor ClpS [Bradyrhizobium sp. RT6a]|uniref:ATP-dependent Clp protease adaptor ClpS n=1 Tax=unclassified Bradyrhizobium TaxID=2631580 RepID=UPI003399230A